MEEQNIQIIGNILNAIEIGKDRRLYFEGKEYNSFGDGEISNEMLSHNLQQLIYKEFYMADRERSNGKEVGPHNDPPTPPDDFLQRLRTANSSRERWDRGWMVDSIDMNGSLHVKKGNFSRHAYSGEFIKESFAHRSTEKNDSLKLLVRNEHWEKDDVFYFVFGETLAEDQYEWLARFYFNLAPEGSPPLIRAICRGFNRYFIPFQFKCLNHPHLYSRTDAAVLYFDRRYFTIGYEILSGIYRALARQFRSACPLFTLRIAPGFAFAENPPDPAESFGSSRSRLIARAVVAAFNEARDKQTWIQAVSGTIRQNGYDLNSFYLNPGSHYPYHFNYDAINQ